MTKSSLEGGIFGGHNHVEAPVSRPVSTPRVDVQSMACAGAPIVRNEAFTFDDSSAPLQPLPSARRNNNASSQPGGIFGSEPIKHQPGVKRNNPNASSIEGGMCAHARGQLNATEAPAMSLLPTPKAPCRSAPPPLCSMRDRRTSIPTFSDSFG